MKKKITKVGKIVNNAWNKFINLKGINLLFKFLPQNIFLFIFLIISIFTITNFYNANKYKYYYYQKAASDNVGPIYNESYKISFEEVELTGNPEELCLTFGTYAHKITSDYRYILYKGNELVTDEIFNGSKLQDGVNYCFDTPGITKDNVKEYSAVIAPINADENNAITIYKSASKNIPTMYFIAEEKINEGRMVVALIFILVFFAINYFVNTKKIKPEYFWLIISSIYILFVMFAMPPYQVPDEHIHYVNAINLSQTDFSKNLFTQFDAKEIYVPEDFGCIDYSKTQKLDKVNEFKDITECLKNQPNELKTDWHVSSKSKLGYIFTTIAYKIADILTDSPLILFYSGRILNTIVSIIMIFYAIKLAPRYKEILLSVAAIPMFIQELISYSYDAMLNSICIMVVAIILNLIYNEKSRVVPWFFILLIFGIIISDIKFIYLPIFLLLLFIPDKKFKKKYMKWIYCIGLILLCYVIGKFTRWLVEYDPSEGVEIYTALQSKKFNFLNVKEHPWMIFSIAFYTIQYQTVFYLRGLFGFFGWFRYKFSDIIIFGCCLYMLYLLLSNKKIESTKFKKIIVIIGLLISFGSIFAAMYFGWSKPGLGYVEGVQGRYFFPILIPIMLLFLPKKEIFKQNEKINYWFINIILLQFVLLILFGYY